MEGSALSLLHPVLRRVMESLGYKRLLPVQEKSIPVILSGAHTLIVAPTGSGKTEAALLPVLSQMLRLREHGALGGGVKLVYVTPLRALNRDIEQRIRKLVEGSGFSIMVRHGDTTQSLRKQFLRESVDVVITTPESLSLLLTVARARRLWRGVRWVIVDELQEFIDSERGSELAVALERLERSSGRRVQRIGLSATLSRRTIDMEAVRLLGGRRRVEVVVDPSPKEYDIRLEVVGGDSESFWKRAAARIAEIITSTRGKVLVFVNTRSTAEKLAAEIEKHASFRVAVHHGSLGRKVREEAEAGFKSGDIKALVATSSMELGVDIGSVDLVVQFLSPRSIITMVQRAGRAGHRFGETSKAVIVTSINIFEVLESGVIALRAMRGHLEDQHIHVNPLDALAHQVAGIVLEEKEAAREWLLGFVRRAAPFHHLPDSDFNEVVDHLIGVRVLREKEEGTLSPGSRIYKYFYRVSMIPDERNYTVHDIVSGNKIGELSERFVEARLMEMRENRDRFLFVLAGKIWEALDIDPERARIDARPIAESSGYIPSWEGELIPVNYKVAREVCSILSLCMVDEAACKRLLAARRIPGDVAERITSIARQTAELWGGPLLSPTRPVIEVAGRYTILYVCLGSKGNFALALLLSKILENWNLTVEFTYIPYAIAFSAPGGVPPRLLAKALEHAKNLDSIHRRLIVSDAVRESTAFLVRFVQVAKRMGVVDPDKSVSRELAKRMINAYRDSVVERETLREIIYDKLDISALEEFLTSMEHPEVAPRGVEGEPSAIAREVLENPYMKRDKAVDIRSIALSKLIESYKRRLREKRVIVVCASCGHHWEARAASIGNDTRCPRCGSRLLAVLPSSDWGREALSAFLERKRGRRVRGEKAKLAREVLDRAKLFALYYSDGMSRLVVEALSAYGVGPQRARRILEAYLTLGEEAFYKELFKAMEEYAANRKYWKTPAQRTNKN